MKINDLQVVVVRGETLELSDLPERTIALDGAVRGPSLDLAAQRISLDHHDNCLRLVTSATCTQVLDALCVGFDPHGWTALVNDVDGDTALAVALLANPHWVGNERAHRLVDAVGKVDAHGPAYHLVGEARVLADDFYGDAMAPETTARRNREYGSTDLDDLLTECVSRIEELVAGTLDRGDRTDDRDLTVTHVGDGWVLANSDDFVFDHLYADGHDAAVVYQQLPDGTYAYTVGRRSDLVCHFDVPAIIAALCAIEDGWGGGSSIGGAPRNSDGSRSRLTPTEVIEVITATIAS